MHTTLLRVISLNTWGDCTGRILEDIKRLKENADVLCFQEVHNSPDSVPTYIWPKDPGKRTGHINTKLFAQIEELLGSEFVGYYAPQMFGYVHDSEASDYPELEYGNAMFVRTTHAHGYRSGFIYGHKGKVFDAATQTPAGKTGQAVDIYDGTGFITVAHAHGAWFMSDKHTNFDWRNEQVDGILRLMAPQYERIRVHEGYKPRAILVGDLNVVSATHTVRDIVKSRVFGRTGGFHLNARNNVFRTRTALYTGQIMEADHAFASACLEATMWVDDTVNSDHAALIVEANTSAR